MDAVCELVWATVDSETGSTHDCMMPLIQVWTPHCGGGVEVWKEVPTLYIDDNGGERPKPITGSLAVCLGHLAKPYYRALPDVETEQTQQRNRRFSAGSCPAFRRDLWEEVRRCSEYINVCRCEGCAC